MADTSSLSPQYLKQLREEREARLAAKKGASAPAPAPPQRPPAPPKRDDIVEIESSDDEVQIIASAPKRKRAKISPEQKAEQVRAAGHPIGLVSQQSSQQAGRSHGGREKPVLGYIRDMCTLRVIKREYNESDAVLPWLESHKAQAAQ